MSWMLHYLRFRMLSRDFIKRYTFQAKLCLACKLMFYRYVDITINIFKRHDRLTVDMPIWVVKCINMRCRQIFSFNTYCKLYNITLLYGFFPSTVHIKQQVLNYINDTLQTCLHPLLYYAFNNLIKC